MGPTCGKHNRAMHIEEVCGHPGKTQQVCSDCKRESSEQMDAFMVKAGERFAPRLDLYDLLDQAQATQRDLEKQLEEKTKLRNAYLPELNDYAKTVKNLNAKIEKLKGGA